MITAIVPIKKKSARLPNKNFLDFNGKPLWQVILGVLAEVPEITQILVNTDSEQIYRSPVLPKCKYLMRPENLCGNLVSMNDIIAHTIENTSSNIFIQTHCTNPLVKPSTFSKAIRALGESGSLFGVTVHHKWFYTQDGLPVNHDVRQLLNTQDLPPIMEDNSCFYVFTREAFNKTGTRRGDNPKMFPVPKLEAIDIDDEEDFRMALALC